MSQPPTTTPPSPPCKLNPWRGHLMALVAVICWSASFAYIRNAREELDAIALYLVRFVVASILVLIMWLGKPPRIRALPWKAWANIILLAVLVGPVYQILLMYGAGGVPSAMLGLLIGTQTFHVAWLGAVFLRERFTLRHVAAMLIAFVGVALPVLMSGDATGMGAMFYPVLVALSAVVSAITIVMARGMRHQFSSYDMMTMMIVIATLVSLPLTSPAVIEQWRDLSPGGWGSVAYLASFGQVFATLMFYSALRHLTAMTSAFYLFILMALSGVWGWIIRGEPMTLWHGAALLLVLAGLWLQVQTKPEPDPALASPDDGSAETASKQAPAAQAKCGPLLADHAVEPAASRA